MHTWGEARGAGRKRVLRKGEMGIPFLSFYMAKKRADFCKFLQFYSHYLQLSKLAKNSFVERVAM